ncbi:very long-chain specific acyl-CoA dehydrogenase, mitochondrial-like [Ornithodoros turicata]|uniref:very long-chain specific acyl-CoA dehydrogenase, mitochondrial-like n=1 Tax=Ornithodoros turicata TaxID=34597 RepID=UPI00313972A6
MFRSAASVICTHSCRMKLLKLVRLTSTSSGADSRRGRNRSFKKMESNSFLMNIFKGEANMEQMFPFPDVLTDDQLETLRMVLGPVYKFLTEVNDAKQNDMEEKFSDATIEGLKELGAYGMQVPPEMGGIGANNCQTARLSETIGEFDIGLGIALGAHQSIGFKGILLFGNEKQKRKYLPSLAAGDKLAAYCLTEPTSGSDAMSIKTRAVPSPDGKHFILNGGKIWISNGGIADIFTVFAQTPVKTDSGEVKDRITAFIVERSFKGVSSGPAEKKMGIRASNTATVNFDDVQVPVENVLGEVGEGFKVAMHILNNGRFGMAALLCGTMRSCIARATEHATMRSQFGNKLATYGSIQEKIARMAMALYVSESMTYMLSGNMDRGFTDYHLEAACTKITASESAWFTADETIQIHGGIGFMREAGLERVMRDLRIFRIFEGANDILRLFIALQGLQFAGGHLKDLQRAMRNPTAHLGLILDYGSKRVWRAVGLSTVGSLCEYVPGRLATPAALASRSIEMFGASAESLLMKYGKNIINEQFLLTRLANSAIDIYAMIVVLSRATRAIQKEYATANHEALLVDVICSEASERVQNNLGSLHSGEKLSNFDKMQAVAKEMCDTGGPVPHNPLNV